MMSPWVQLAGRLHPLLLHAPIGLFIAVAALEAARVLRKDPKPASAAILLSWLGVASALASTGTGWLLAEEPAYGDSAELHRWLAIAFTGTFLIYAIALSFSALRFALFMLIASGGLMTAAGHFGASLTHGANFLFEPFAEKRPPREPSSDSSLTPGLPVAPSQPVIGAVNFEPIAVIFDNKCVSCHSDTKSKGGLALHTLEAINRGAEAGPVIEWGNPDDSEIVIRMRLPLDDEFHMPPEGKPQLTDAEQAAIIEWIRSNPASSSSLANPTDTPSSRSTAAQPVPAQPTPAPPLFPSAQLVEGINRALAAGGNISPAHLGSQLFVVDFSQALPRPSPDALVTLLRPLAANILDLNLSATDLSPPLVDLIASTPSLERLDLRATKADDQTCQSLTSSTSIKTLILSGTKITDAGLDSLASIATLRTLFVWNTPTTPQGRQAFAATHNSIKLLDGATATLPPLETEPPFQLTSEAPLPGSQPPSPPAATPAALLRPVNDTCLVSGGPIDARYLVVYEGKVIAFCCPNCPKQFWEDPAKYISKLSPSP